MDEPAQIKIGRLLWAGPLTVALSVAAVLLIRTLTVAVLNPDAKFLPLTTETPISDTVILSACAVFVFFSMGRYSLEPVREYRSLAWKVLLVSFGPDIAVAMLHWFGGGWPEALALMAMHIAVWAICVTMLPTFVGHPPFVFAPRPWRLEFSGRVGEPSGRKCVRNKSRPPIK